MSEIDKLEQMLKEANIPFRLGRCWSDTKQIIYYNNDGVVCDAVCHPYSYGYKEGLIEIMGLSDNEDGVEGYLTADEVFNRIKDHYKSDKSR